MRSTEVSTASVAYVHWHFLIHYFWRLALLRAFDESLPLQSLFFPVWQDRNGTHFAFAEAGDVVGGGFKVEDRFLDVRGELGEVDDLSYASTGDAGGAGDLGLVFDLTGGK